MAPEVLDSGGYTYSADIYSLGVVLHEMASLEQPYSRFPKNLVKRYKNIYKSINISVHSFCPLTGPY